MNSKTDLTPTVIVTDTEQTELIISSGPADPYAEAASRCTASSHLRSSESGLHSLQYPNPAFNISPSLGALQRALNRAEKDSSSKRDRLYKDNEHNNKDNSNSHNDMDGDAHRESEYDESLLQIRDPQLYQDDQPRAEVQKRHNCVPPPMESLGDPPSFQASRHSPHPSIFENVTVHLACDEPGDDSTFGGPSCDAV